MPYSRSYGPPLRSRIFQGKLQFFDGTGWIGIRTFLDEADPGLTIEEVSNDLADTLEEVVDEEPEET